MTEPKVAAGSSRSWLSLFVCCALKEWLFTETKNLIQWRPSQLKYMPLTCPAPQCTDVESAHLHRCAGPPTSPQMLAGTVTGRLPSWRTALWDFGPRSQIWRWPRSAPVLPNKGHKLWWGAVQHEHHGVTTFRPCLWLCVAHLHHWCWVRCLPRQELRAHCGGFRWDTNTAQQTERFWASKPHEINIWIWF